MRFIKDNWKVALFSAFVGAFISDVWIAFKDVLYRFNWAAAGQALIHDPVAQSLTASFIVPTILIWWHHRRFKFEIRNSPVQFLMMYGVSLGQLGVLTIHMLAGDAETLFAKIQEEPLSSMIILGLPTVLLAHKAITLSHRGDGGETRRGS